MPSMPEPSTEPQQVSATRPESTSTSDAFAMEEALRELVRQRLGCEPEPPVSRLDEGARAWAVGPAPRSARHRR
jgi:hypothetical protein